MQGRHIPYLVGGFMLVPLVLWLGLWAFAFPGPKLGLDAPVTLAMGVVSLPLAAWFYLATLGMFANSVRGTSEFALPQERPVGRLIQLLPATALVLGAGSFVVLAMLGSPLLEAAVPFAIGLAIAWAIRFGERARGDDARVALGGARSRSGALAALRSVAGLGIRLVYAVPVVGWMAREAAEGGAEDKFYFLLTLVLGAILAVAFFGYPVLIALALSATVLAFVFILMATLG